MGTCRIMNVMICNTSDHTDLDSFAAGCLAIASHHLKISGLSRSRAHRVLRAPENFHRRASGLRVARVLDTTEC